MTDESRLPWEALEYVRDVPYPRRFIPQIAPSQLRLVAALNGFAPPPEDDFDYGELGCGNGDTLTLLAAANPLGRFVGVDFNPEHVRCATSLARRGALTNVRILGTAFEDLDGEDLPSFDILVAHGILSWVAPETAEAVLSFAQKKLKPGGLLYVSYNAMPGWAAMAPLRRIMLEITANTSGTSLERARDAVHFLHRLADGGAAYFANHPTAKTMLSLMRTGGPAYVAHEYFNAYLRPLWSADVATDMAKHGLSFAGQLPLALNVPDLSIPPSIRKLSADVKGRAALETIKDFATNELFRSDVFLKGDGQRSVSEMRSFFETTPFGSTAPYAQIKREVRLPLVTLDYRGPAYDAILPALATGPKSAAELAHVASLAPLGQTRIGECLQNLTLGGQIVPMRATEMRREPGAPVAFRSLYNHVALDEALSGDGPLVLASPITGTAVHISLLDAITLKVLPMTKPDRATWLREFAAARPTPLRIGEKKLKDVDDLARVIDRELEKIPLLLPKLIELGVF